MSKDILAPRESFICEGKMTLFATEQRIYMEAVSPDGEDISAVGSGQSLEDLRESFETVTGYLNMGDPDSATSGHKVIFYKALLSQLPNGDELLVVGESLGDHTQGGYQKAEEFLTSLTEG